jgi:hypothetical protein
MHQRHLVAVLTCALLVGSVPSLDADVRSEERNQVKFEGMLGRVVNVFGGRAAREGIKSTVAVQGDRKATTTDQTGQIVDLREEKIYDLDLRRKTYRVTTFADLRRQMEEARQKAEAEAKAEAKRAGEQPAEPAADPSRKDVEFDFTSKETGLKKAVNGFDAREVVLVLTMREKGTTLEESGGLVLTSNVWLTESLAAMKEIADFDLRYAKQLAGPMLAGASAQEMGAALAMYPGLQGALEKVRAESVNLEGTPVMTTMTVEAVKSAAELAAEVKQAEADAKPTASGGIGGLVGGLARRAIRRDQPPQQRATFMTVANEVLSVTTNVAATDVAIPEGFKEVR